METDVWTNGAVRLRLGLPSAESAAADAAQAVIERIEHDLALLKVLLRG